VLYVIADGSKKDKRGPKNPAAQKGRLNAPFLVLRDQIRRAHGGLG